MLKVSRFHELRQIHVNAFIKKIMTMKINSTIVYALGLEYAITFTIRLIPFGKV